MFAFDIHKPGKDNDHDNIGLHGEENLRTNPVTLRPAPLPSERRRGEIPGVMFNMRLLRRLHSQEHSRMARPLLRGIRFVYSRDDK